MEGEKNKAIGMSRGGRITKLHTVVDGLGNPIAFLLSPGNEHDSVRAVALLEMIELEGSNVIGDKAYGSKEIREYITSRGASYVIPPKSNTKEPWDVDIANQL